MKELRLNFPKIKAELDNGVSFELIYRSKPIAILKPKNIEATGDFDFSKYVLQTPKNLKQFSATDAIREDRE